MVALANLLESHYGWRMNKLLIVLGCSVFITACATSKPQLMENRYAAFAERLTSIQNCVVRGYMPPAIGAKGRAYTVADLNTWSFNTDLMQSRIRQVQGSVTPSQGDCNAIAMDIEQRTNELEEDNLAAEREQQAWQMYQQSRPLTTTCNKIGTQTFCNTY